MKIKKTILTAGPGEREALPGSGDRFFTGTEQECRDQYIHLERYMHATA